MFSGAAISAAGARVVGSASTGEPESQLAQEFMAQGMPRELAVAKAQLQEQVKRKKRSKEKRHKDKHKVRKQKR